MAVEIGPFVAALAKRGLAYRDPCQKLAYSAKVEVRGHVGCGQTSTLVSFGLTTSAPAAGVQRAPGSPTAPRDLPHAWTQWIEQL